jgi:hypothetical protein
MKFRLTAFAFHLLGSFCALSLVLGALYLGWYHWPGWWLSSVIHIVLIVVMVDLVLGPTLTFVVAGQHKARRVLARDIGLIVLVQLVALGYGAVTLWMGRPLYYAFSADCLQLVQASDLTRDDIVKSQQQNPGLAPFWFSRPRWIWAPLPDDAGAAAKIVQDVTMGKGQDVIQMPSYFKPWDQGLPTLKAQLKPVGEIKYLNKREKQSLTQQMARDGLTPTAANSIIFWGGSRRLLAIVDPQSLQIKALLKPD